MSAEYQTMKEPLSPNYAVQGYNLSNRNTAPRWDKHNNKGESHRNKETTEIEFPYSLANRQQKLSEAEI